MRKLNLHRGIQMTQKDAGFIYSLFKRHDICENLIQFNLKPDRN